MDNSDLVVSRSGMNTLLELAVKSAPALIIPIPIGSEQKQNAKYFQKLGLGEVLEEKNITPEIFIEKIKQMLNRKIGLKELAYLTKKSVILDADKKLTQEILVMLNNQINYQMNFK